MNEQEFTIEITPVFVPGITEGFRFTAIWKGFIKISGFDSTYYNAERRAQRQVDEWKEFLTRQKAHYEEGDTIDKRQ